jgi:hypothetical protein
LRDPRLPSLHSLDAYLFTHLSLGIMLGLLPLRGISGLVAGLPDMFCGVNENFATAAIEGALVLAGDSVDLEAVRVGASEGGTVVLPAGSSVQKAVRAVSKKWWRSFGYDYILSVIRAQQVKVLSYF